MISGISTASLSNTLTNSIVDLQKRLSVAQKEVTTGQYADLVGALGSQFTRSSTMHLSVSDIDAITASNNVVLSRLSVTQTSLQKLSSDAQDVLKALVPAQGGVINASAIVQQAKTSLGNMISTLNVSDGGVPVFGGVNGDKPPVADYSSNPPSAAETALEGAFTSTFGFPPSDPRVSTITGAQMSAFLSGPMANLFSAANWTANWSSASNQPLQNRISVTQTSDTSVTANDPAMQKLAAGYSMLAGLGLENMGADAAQAVISTATNYFSQAVSGLTDLQQKVGVMQSNVQSAQDNMATTKDLLNTQIGTLENVDPTEASVTVNNLMTQIETAYSLTARIQQLSLAKYL
jgi:flagellar hook-associated protein 3 FlgL